jgi:tetratricopeptide (TPR) repeat protein
MYRRAERVLRQGNFPEAERIFRALIRKLKTLPPQALQVDVHRSLGDLYRFVGRYRESESALQTAFRIADKVYPPEAVERWLLLNSRAVLYKYSGRFTEAARLYDKALKLLTKINRGHETDIATIYHNLGGLEHTRGRPAIGERFARKGLAIRRRVTSPGDPDVAADEAALAALLAEQKKYSEAQRLCQRALRTFRRKRENYDTAIGLSNLGSIHFARGNFRAARRCHEEALRIKEKLLGRHHVDVAITLNNLAMLYGRQERFNEAEKFLGRALSILQSQVPPRHPIRIKCRANYLAVQRALKANAERMRR